MSSELSNKGFELTEALIEHDRELDSIYKDVVSLSGRADCLADGLTVVCNGLAEESADKWQLIGTLRCLIEAARTINCHLSALSSASPLHTIVNPSARQSALPLKLTTSL